MAGLKPSVNLFAFLDSDDPGEKRLVDFDAAKAKEKNTAPKAKPIKKPASSAASGDKLKKTTPAAASGGSKTKKPAPADPVRAFDSKANKPAPAAPMRAFDSKAKNLAPVAFMGRDQAPATSAVGFKANNNLPPAAPAARAISPPVVKSISVPAESMARNKKQQPVTSSIVHFSYPSAEYLKYSNPREQYAQPTMNNDISGDDNSGRTPAQNYNGKDGAKQGERYYNGAPTKQQPSVAAKQVVPAPAPEAPPAPVQAPPPPSPPSLYDINQFPSLK